jgi:hypothetical protein
MSPGELIAELSQSFMAECSQVETAGIERVSGF